MQFTVIDCCPVPTTGDFHKIVQMLLNEANTYLVSCYRGQDPHAQKYLTGGAPCYKHNQAWIYANYPPGVANPPGISTHECRNDGAAYPVPVGAKLEYWQVGLDVDTSGVHRFMEAGRRHGYVITQTYPGSAVEAHHVNFRFRPKYVPPFNPLNKGDHGRRVEKLTRRLHYIHERGNGPFLDRSYKEFKQPVVAAVKHFQQEHHLDPDGVVGIHTFEQIERTFRHQWKARHKRRKNVPRRHRVRLDK